MRDDCSQNLHTENRTQYATFKLGEQIFGINVLNVQEILKVQEMTPVPLAPAYICGLINLRGRIVTAIDLGKRLTNRPAPPNASRMSLVASIGEQIVSLLVDEIGDVVEMDNALMESPPPTMTTIRPEYLDGVCKLENKLLMVLNIERLLQSEQS